MAHYLIRSEQATVDVKLGYVFLGLDSSLIPDPKLVCVWGSSIFSTFISYYSVRIFQMWLYEVNMPQSEFENLSDTLHSLKIFIIASPPNQCKKSN